TAPKVPSISGRVVNGFGLMLEAMGSCARFKHYLITGWRLDQPDLRRTPAGLAYSRNRRTTVAGPGPWNAGLVRLRAREFHDFRPFLGFLGDIFAELGGRTCNQRRAHAGEPLPHAGIGEDRLHRRIELVDDLGRRVLRRADAVPRARLVARHEI